MAEINCDTGYIGRQYLWLKETDSTNSLMRRLIGDGVTIEGIMDSGRLIEGNPPEGTLIISDHQNAGRGRSGHSWESPAGTSIAMSLLLKPKIDDDSIPMVTLIAALAVCRAIENECGIKAAIKWPNDILINNRKVCGILTELYTGNDGKSLIVGVGINANQDEFPAEIADIATSLKLELDDYTDREALVEGFAKAFEEYYEIFLKTGDMSELKDRYESLLINTGREVKVLVPGETITGTAGGIDERGRLLVKTSDGVIHPVYAGEVSVRGIYGYV